MIVWVPNNPDPFLPEGTGNSGVLVDTSNGFQSTEGVSGGEILSNCPGCICVADCDLVEPAPDGKKYGRTLPFPPDAVVGVSTGGSFRGVVNVGYSTPNPLYGGRSVRPTIVAFFPDSVFWDHFQKAKLLVDPTGGGACCGIVETWNASSTLLSAHTPDQSCTGMTWKSVHEGTGDENIVNNGYVYGTNGNPYPPGWDIRDDPAPTDFYTDELTHNLDLLVGYDLFTSNTAQVLVILRDDATNPDDKVYVYIERAPAGALTLQLENPATGAADSYTLAANPGLLSIVLDGTSLTVKVLDATTQDTLQTETRTVSDVDGSRVHFRAAIDVGGEELDGEYIGKATAVCLPPIPGGGAGIGNLTYRRGCEPIPSTVHGWSYTINPTNNGDIGGFGIAFGTTDFDAKVGVDTPGVMLYIEADGWQICNSGACRAIPTGSISRTVSVELIVNADLTGTIKWFVDSVYVAEETFPLFPGNIWYATVGLNYKDINVSIDAFAIDCEIPVDPQTGLLDLSNEAAFTSDAVEELAELVQPLYVGSEIPDDSGDNVLFSVPTTFVSDVFEHQEDTESCVVFVSEFYDPVDFAETGVIFTSETVDIDEVVESEFAPVSETVDVVIDLTESEVVFVTEEVHHATTAPPVVIPPSGTGNDVYCMNASTSGITRYTGLDVFALANHEGRVLMLREDALLEMDSAHADDNGVPIVAVLRTGAMNLGVQNDKHCHRVYVTGVPAEGLVFKTHSKERGVATERAYSLAARDGDESRTRFTNFGRGAYSPYWGLEVNNVNGGPLDFTWSALLIGATRRLR